MSSIQRSPGANTSATGGRLIDLASSGLPLGQTWRRASEATHHAATAMSAQDNETEALTVGALERNRRFAKLVAAIRCQPAKIIGITGTRAGVGVSTVARELAFTLSGFAGKILLVDLSRLKNLPAEPATSGNVVQLPQEAQRIGTDLFVLRAEDLNNGSLTVEGLRAQLLHAVQSGFTVVLDLSPILEASAAPAVLASAAAAACDQVYLVCLSGESTEQDVVSCAEASTSAGLKLSGLILNDWHMPASSLISG